MNWTRPRSEVIQQLRNHCRALEASAKSYDAGEKWEAQRLATAVYTLVHDGAKNSRSILTQLGIRGSLRFISSGRAHHPENLISETPLVMIQMGGGGIDYIPQLGNGPIPPKPVQFHIWWEDELIFRDESLSLNRRKLVFALRNKEGGGHLDAQLDDEGYLRMSRESARSWFIQRGQDQPKALLGLEAVTMRQIAWELMKTFEALPKDMQ